MAALSEKISQSEKSASENAEKRVAPVGDSDKDNLLRKNAI